MENQELQSLLQLPEYQFIHTNPLLKNNIMFLTLGGSHAYEQMWKVLMWISEDAPLIQSPL